MSDQRRGIARYGWCLVICLVLELIVLVWPEAKTADDGWVGRGVSGAIAGETVLEQWIHSTGPNLRAVTFYPKANGSRLTATVNLSLIEVRTDDRRLIDERRVPAAEVVAADAYTYRFQPIALSTFRNYILTISVPDAAPGAGLAVEVMRRRYGDNPPNRLYFGGRERWGSLRFTGEIDRPTLLVRTIRYVRKAAFGPWTLLILFASWIALHVLGARAVMLVAAAACRQTPADTSSRLTL
jgi:hypothetical protein